MLGKGNGEPMQCVSNLLRMTRGECVYDRIKGMDPELIDMNSDVAIPLMAAEAKWLIKTYEPRVDINSVDIEGLVLSAGSFALNVNTDITG